MEKKKAKQTKTGKAFEYSLAKTYHSFLTSRKLSVNLIEDKPLLTAKAAYEFFEKPAQAAFDYASKSTLNTLIRIEPGLTQQKSRDDILQMRLASDAEGQKGDVRDLIFSRKGWEIGFSAKNNHTAAKHSRLAYNLDFGKEWFDVPVNQSYFASIRKVFDQVDLLKKQDPSILWNEVKNLHEKFYIPVLIAFQRELLRINKSSPGIPSKLINYLIGNKPFYKIIKEDNRRLVVVKAFNLNGSLNRAYNGKKPDARAGKLKPPNRIIEFDFKKDSSTTLIMIMDEGWQVSFRIHTADGAINTSLKFDVQLTGNPPVLFTQHLFIP